MWCAGMVGVLSLLFVDFNALAQKIPMPEGQEPPAITPLIKIASLIQPLVLVAIGVVVGLALAHRIGLSAPVAEAIARRKGIWEPLRPQIIPGIIGGLVAAIAIILTAYIAGPHLPADAGEKISGFLALMPLVTRMLYGGIIEELLLRWGFLTFLVWLAWRIFQKSNGVPRPIFFVGAIILSAIVFGIGHLPIAYLLFPGRVDSALTLFVIVANSLFGLIAGFLYWKKGLEAAIVAHMITHLVMFAAGRVGAYYG